ncbi:MAG: peptidylprolyl isomerase [Bacteriovoracaceae bacterium]|jgi:peptidyl-prolyl cis-trans isomerase C|nr:peptidylprolyl isomerase [Bacteriovoracaceae bacterium]
MNKIFYRARHILVEYKEDAEYILKQLNTGMDFEKLAKDYSECSSSEEGGNLGKFPSGVMVPEFERALYNMKVGQVSEPIRTKFGYHIIERLEL